MKKFSFLLLSLFTVLVIVSCSKKEDPIEIPEASLSLTLKSDAGSEDLEVIDVNSEVAFTVVGSDGVDYTDLSQLFVNDQKIEGSTHIFSTPGQFSVKAQYNDIVSNILTFEVLEGNERILIVDVTKALRNQTVTFTLRDKEGNDRSSESTFYVNGKEISGNSFSSATPDKFKVYASYNEEGQNFTSAEKTFEVFIPKRKVVIEDYTGTWCGYCPGVAIAIEDVRKATKDVSVVAIHKESGGVPDPLDFSRIEELQEMFGINNGFPKARLNRTIDWPRPYIVSEATALAGTNTEVSIAILSQLTGSNLTVKVNVVYENGSTPGDKLVVYLLENGVVAPQANYFNETPGHEYEGLGNPIPDYIHNDALRNSLSDLFGDPIPNLPAFEQFTKEYSFTVPSHYVGQNLSFVVMVVNAENSAKNSQFSTINEKKDFE